MLWAKANGKSKSIAPNILRNGELVIDAETLTIRGIEVI